MSTDIFDIKEALTAGWEGFKNNAVIFVVLPLALAIVSIVIYGFAMLFTMVLPFLILLMLPIIILIETVLTAYVMFCLIKAALAVLKGEKPSWEILRIDIPSFIKFAAVFIIIAIATSIVSGVVSFVFPVILGANMASMAIVTLLLTAITVAVMTFFFPAQYIIIDKQSAGIVDAIKNSWNMTFPRVVPCLIFILICFVINFIGSIPLGLGLLVTMPVTIIAAAFVYKKLDNAPAETTATPVSPEPSDTASK